MGAVGVVLTALGLWASVGSLRVAAAQLRRTTTANEAATNAAIQALTQSREQYNGHLLNEAHAHMETAKSFVTTKKWDLVVMRLGDLANVLTLLGIGDAKLGGFAGRVRNIEMQFHRVAATEIQFDTIQIKWQKLAGAISAEIAIKSAPFALTDQGDNHD